MLKHYKQPILRLLAVGLILVVASVSVVLSRANTSHAAVPMSTTASHGGDAYSLFGTARIVSPGDHSAHSVQIKSSSVTGPGFGGIAFEVPNGFTFNNVVTLSTAYDFTHNSCGGGSPRFQINVVVSPGVTKSAFVYIGPPPDYTDCAENTWVTTGNLVGPTAFVDTSQLPGGNFYDTFASADAKYGSDAVTGIQLVADGGWFFADHIQNVLLDNVQINTKTFGFEH